MMAEQETKRIGGNTVLKGTLIPVLIGELYWLVQETQGDFANGILFYISHHLNVFVALFYIVLLGTAFLLGQKAAAEIRISDKEVLVTYFKYASISSILIGSYCLVATRINNGDLLIALEYSLMIFFLEVAVWLWAGQSIRKRLKSLEGNVK